MTKKIDIQGHRGCRGLMPENTIPAFIHAVDIGVHTLELDLVVNKNEDVIISHEPFFNHEISIGPNDDAITEENEKTHNLYPLKMIEIESYDVGMKLHPRFPDQKKMEVAKPMLTEMVTAVEGYIEQKGLPAINYNIEIKRNPEYDNLYHPEMKLFADLCVMTIKDLGIMPRTTVQCFDVETLQYLHEKYPGVKLVYLVANKETIKENIDKLGFKPYVYSPYYPLANKELVEYCNQEDIKLIPWTVNNNEAIQHMIDLNVDGIISDFPDRVINIIEANKASK